LRDVTIFKIVGAFAICTIPIKARKRQRDHPLRVFVHHFAKRIELERKSQAIYDFWKKVDRRIEFIDSEKVTLAH